MSDASCIGRYMAVSIEQVFPNVDLSAITLEKTLIGKRITLARILFSNTWHHRIEIQTHLIKMIDTAGMQHATTKFDEIVSDISVSVSRSKV